MAGIAYIKLFNALFKHTFYESGISKKDLSVIPTAATADALKNSNMLFRKDDGGFRVLYKGDPITAVPFIPFDNVRLTFVLQLLNPVEFMNFSDLTDNSVSPPKKYGPGKILYFNNLGTGTASDLNYSLIDYLRPTSFTYRFPQTATGLGDTANIIIKDQAGNIVTPLSPPSTLIVPDDNNKYHYPIDFTKLPKGLYTFDTWKTAFPNPGDHTIESIYIDNDLARSGVFGIVDLSFADYTQVPVSKLYNARFFTRGTQWKYVIVLKSPSAPAPGDVSITDDATQSPYGPLVFTPVTGTIMVNGITAKVFNSTTSNIPYFEVPKKSLTINGASGPVISNIPGPPLGVISADPADFNITQIFVTI
ncbi:MAG: hypothetical protein ACJ77K_09420 [Bacteroidia bacterium]